MAAKIYAVCNQKGGCAKSVTSVNLGIGLARLGRRVLLVDVDSQGSMTASLGYQQPDQIETTLTNALKGVMEEDPLPHGGGILHHSEGIDLLPANILNSRGHTAPAGRATGHRCVRSRPFR